LEVILPQTTFFLRFGKWLMVVCSFQMKNIQ
jgi:hypothetical protein